jgi:thymidylate synthase ThyX
MLSTVTPRGYTITLAFPDRDIGPFLEQLAMVAARGDRSLKPYDELWQEVEVAADVGKLGPFLERVVKTDWALDVAELNIFVWHIEGIPSFLVPEWLRHRLIARDWSFQQLSKRAIHADRIEFINPFSKETEATNYLIAEVGLASIRETIKALHDKGVSAERIRYLCPEGAKTRLTAGANARALHHFFTMRGSKDIGANGRAYPEFQELVDTMYQQAQEVCPILFKELLKS